MEFVKPFLGFVIGVLIIVFRNKISVLIPKFFKCFPKHEDGVKAFKFDFTVNPKYVLVVGLIFIVIAFNSVVSIIQNNT